MNIYDRRFAADISLILNRDGPDALATILIRVAEDVGFRGRLEEAVFQYALARHPGRPVDLVLIGGDR